MMEWINSGFERGPDARVWIIWECSQCGFEMVLDGFEKPACDCPKCGGKVGGPGYGYSGVK